MKEVIHNPAAWDAVAVAYDDSARARLEPFSAAAIEWAGLGPDDEVLDVACGPGTTTFLVAPRVRSVDALDFSPGMIEVLRTRAREVSNVTAAVGDGQALEFPAGRFAAAFSMFGLVFFPDPVAALRELYRVLRPGGQVFISCWVPFTESPMMQLLGEAMRIANPPDPDAPPPPPLAWDSVELLAGGLREAGFSDVEVRRLPNEQEVRNGDHFWADAAANIFVDRLRAQKGEAWPDIEATILAHLRTRLQGGAKLDMPGLLGRGVKPDSSGS